MSEILERYNQMLQNPTPPNRFEFNAYLKEQSIPDILEASKDLMIHLSSIETLKTIYESGILSVDQAKEELSKVQEVKSLIFGHDQLQNVHNTLHEVSIGLESYIELKSSDEYLIETTIQHFESLEDKFTKQIQNQVTLESYNEQGPDALFFNTLKASLESSFGKQFVSLTKAETMEEFMSTLESMMAIATRHAEVVEDYMVYEAGGVKEKVRKAAIRGDEASRKAYTKVRKGASETKRVGTIAKKATERFTNLVDTTIDKFRQMDADTRREAVIRGGIQKKFIKFLHIAVTTGVLSMFSPIMAGISLVVAVALNKRTDKRVRDALITDLETELRVIKEKLRDADNNGDRQAKYKLMRLEALVEKEILRIKTGNRDLQPMNYRELKKGDKK